MMHLTHLLGNIMVTSIVCVTHTLSHAVPSPPGQTRQDGIQGIWVLGLDILKE